MQKHKGLKRTLLALAIIINVIAEIAALTFLFFVYIYPIKSTAPTYTYELGDTLITDTDYYVEANEYALAISEIDFSQVDMGQTGNYTVQIKRAFQLIDIQIEIVDTTPPDLTLVENEIYLEVGEPYSADKFISAVNDLSGSVILEVSLGTTNDYGSQLSAGAIGEYTVYVKATDASGNYTVLSRQISADTAPQIRFSKDIYAAIGYEIDYKQNVTVYDDHDGDITDSVVIDSSMIPGDTPGDYYVSYTATDMYGLTTQVTQPIHIYNRLDLQNLINTRQINRFNQIIIGAYNLYDGGIVFADDIDLVMEHFQPAFVRLKYPRSFGSGFIIEVTDSSIIICTNNHVVKTDQPLTVYFYNGFSSSGELVGCMEGIDVAFVKVPLDEAALNALPDLKTVHINKSYVDNITNPTEVAVGFRTINDEAGVWRDRTGYLLAVHTPIASDVLTKYPVYFSNVTDVCAFSAIAYGGSSGSAVLDSSGNLIAMVSYHNDAPNKLGHQYFGMTLDDILDAYEFIFEKEVHYQ